MGQRQTKNRQGRRSQARRMVAMKALNPVHVPPPEHRVFRVLVKFRKSLDQRINDLRNAIWAWFVNHGISIDADAKALYTVRLESTRSDCRWLSAVPMNSGRANSISNRRSRIHLPISLISSSSLPLLRMGVEATSVGRNRSQRQDHETSESRGSNDSR
jgi:hypothetical protein